MSRNNRLKNFFDIAFERQIIYALKEAGVPRPWTQDSQFNTWYFCNVFRKQDKVTKWIIDHLITPYADDKDLWKKLVLARRLSRLETLEGLEKIDGFNDFNRARKFLMARVAAGIPIMTNAFMLGIPDPSLGTNKVDYIFNLISFYEQVHILPEASHFSSIEACVYQLSKAPNMGGFMSYEVASDFTYCKQYLSRANDIMTWANAGPGCRRGVNYVEHGIADTKITQEDALMYMRSYLKEWQDYCDNNLNRAFKEGCSRIPDDQRLFGIPIMNDAMSAFNHLTMREVEHWLCEMDKHERIGPNKRRYPL